MKHARTRAVAVAVAATVLSLGGDAAGPRRPTRW